MKLVNILLTSIIALGMGCKGNDSPSPSPSPTPPPVVSYGFFRNLVPVIPAKSNKDIVAADTFGNPSVTMSVSRSGHKAIGIGNGKYMLIGGEGGQHYDGSYEMQSVIDIFDTATETFTKSNVITNIGRYWRSDGELGFSLTKLPNGKILMIGGVQNATETVEIYDPVTNTIEWIKNVFPEPINNVGYGFYIGNNKVLIVGAWRKSLTDPITSSKNAIIDLAAMKATMYSMPVPVKRFTAVQLSDNSIIYAGGEDDLYTTHSEIWKVDTNAVVTKIGNMTVPRQDYGMCLLSDDKIGIYGGILRGITDNTRYASVEILDPTTGISTINASLLAPRSFTLATQLQTGWVLNAGGVNESGKLVGDEFVHNHSLQLSGTTGNLNIPRMFYSVIPLNNGRLLISGGDTTNTNPLNSAEIYDPAAKLIISYDTSTIITVNSTIHFTSTTSGVVWTVKAIKNGDVTGVIDSSGVYTAPATATKVTITGTNSGITASVNIEVIE